MEFGVLGFNGLVASNCGLGSLSSDDETKTKGSGSGFLKQERSGATKDDLRPTKAAKANDVLASSTLLLQNKNLPLKSVYSSGQQEQQHMLSFSSSKPAASFLRNNGGLVDRSLKTSTLPYFGHLASSYGKDPGNEWSSTPTV
ncbi:hypothetical protein Ancab_016598 [Ancistrocladus abbreviatus]